MGRTPPPPGSTFPRKRMPRAGRTPGGGAPRGAVSTFWLVEAAEHCVAHCGRDGANLRLPA